MACFPLSGSSLSSWCIISGVRGMGSLPLLFIALDAHKYAPDSEPKLSLSLSMSPNLLPCSASKSNLFCCGVCALVVCIAGLPLVLSGTFGGVGVQKDRRVGSPVCVMTSLKGSLSRRPPCAYVVSAVCCPLPLGGSSVSGCCYVLGCSSMVSSSSCGLCGLDVGWC